MHLSVKLLIVVRIGKYHFLSLTVSARRTLGTSRTHRMTTVSLSRRPADERCADHSTDEDACRQYLGRPYRHVQMDSLLTSATLHANSSPSLGPPLTPLAILVPCTSVQPYPIFLDAVSWPSLQRSFSSLCI